MEAYATGKSQRAAVAVVVRSMQQRSEKDGKDRV